MSDYHGVYDESLIVKIYRVYNISIMMGDILCKLDIADEHFYIQYTDCMDIVLGRSRWDL